MPINWRVGAVKVAKRRGSTLLSSNEVTMATKPLSTSQAPVNTLLRRTRVGIHTYPELWAGGGGGGGKEASKQNATQAMPLQTSLELSQISQARLWHWFGFNLPKSYLASLKPLSAKWSHFYRHKSNIAICLSEFVALPNWDDESSV